MHACIKNDICQDLKNKQQRFDPKNQYATLKTQIECHLKTACRPGVKDKTTWAA